MPNNFAADLQGPQMNAYKSNENYIHAVLMSFSNASAGAWGVRD